MKRLFMMCGMPFAADGRNKRASYVPYWNIA